MSIDDFSQSFDQVGVCMVEREFYSDSVCVEFDDCHKSLVLFSLKEKSEVTVSLDQMDRRSFLPGSGYKYSYMRLSVGRIGSEDIQFVDCQLGCSRSIFISETLPPGNYVIMTEAYWNSNVTRKAIIGLYSSSKPTMTKAEINEDIF